LCELLGNLFKVNLSALITRTSNLERREPNQCSGFTLVEVTIVGAMVRLLALITVPSFLRSHDATHRRTCINNLKEIDQAIQRWAREHQQPQNATVDFSDLRPYLKGTIVCPSGGMSLSDSYTITTAADLPVCRKDPQNHVWLGAGD